MSQQNLISIRLTIISLAKLYSVAVVAGNHVYIAATMSKLHRVALTRTNHICLNEHHCSVLPAKTRRRDRNSLDNRRNVGGREKIKTRKVESQKFPIPSPFRAWDVDRVQLVNTTSIVVLLSAGFGGKTRNQITTN
ncbi:hypothetical protein ACFE04_026202 [Oxalis oulophora]